MSATDLLGRWGAAERTMAVWGAGAPETPAHLYGIQVDPLVSFVILDGHTQCWVSKFCRNPLHPGPCKGWKSKLGQVAPGVLKMIEDERKAKLAKKQAAKAAAVKQAAKAVDKATRGVEVDAHPAAKKKLGAKLAAKVLSEDPDAAEAKTKLTQKEMAWHAQKKASQLLAANMAAGNVKTKAAQQKYKRYAQAQIMAALKKDAETGATGPDSEYQKTLRSLSQAIAHAGASKHVQDDEKTDFDSHADLHEAVADAYDKALQKDLTEQKMQGEDPGNVKALDKKLSDLPGEPGSEEHNDAVAQVMGITLKKQKPFDEGPAKPEATEGAMTPAQAKKYATAWGKIAQIAGVPKAQWPALKLKAQNIAMAGGDPMNDPMIQASIKKAVDALVFKAIQNGNYQWDPSAKEFLAEKYAAEIADMLTNLKTKPDEGSLLDLANKLKTKKVGGYYHMKKIEEKFPDLPKKPQGGPAKALPKVTTAAQDKLESDLDDAFGPATPNPAAPPKKSVNALAPDAQAGGSSVNSIAPKNDGGAGAGGPSQAKKAANAFQDVYAEVYGDAPNEDGFTPEGIAAQVLDELATTSDMDGDISINAGVLTAELISQLDDSDGLNLEEKAALAKHLKPMIEQAMKTGDSTQAKVMVQTFKAMGGPQVKAVAKAMKQNIDDGAQPDQDGGTSSPSPMTVVSPHEQATKLNQGLVSVAAQLDPSSGSNVSALLTSPDAIDKVAAGIESGKITPVAHTKKFAHAMAKSIVAKKNAEDGGKMSSVEEAALAQKLGEAIALQIATGQEQPLVKTVAEEDGGFLHTLAAGYVSQKPPVNSLADKAAADAALADPDLDAKMAAGFNTPPGAAPSTGAPATPAAPPPVPDALFKQAGLEPKVYGGLVSQYQLAIAQGDADNAAEALEGLSTAMAKSFAQKHLNGFGFAGEDEQKLAGQVLDKIAKDYLDAIVAGADEPGGLVANLPGIVKNIEESAKQLQADNGWTNPSPNTQKAIDSYKGSKLLVATGALAGNLDTDHTTPPIKAGTKPAGAGGGSSATTAPAMAPATTSAPAKAAKKVAAKKAPAKKAAPKKVSAAAVAAGKGIKPTAKMHGVQVLEAGPTTPSVSAPVSSPIHQNGQTVLPPEGIYPISQVIVDGREDEVAEFNARVNAGLQGKEAAQEPRNFTELTGAQSSAVYNYSGSGYHEINGHLRPPNPKGPSENPGAGGSGGSPVADRVAHMDRAFNDSRITTPITTLRGFPGSEAALGALWTQHRSQSWAGAEIRDLAYSSSSVNMGTARSFAGAGGPNAIVMRIHMPAGTRAINLVGQGAHGGEAEILLNRGARLRIVADNGYQNGARHLDVEVICESDDCAE